MGCSRRRRWRIATRMRADAQILAAACAWADLHPAPDETAAATVVIPRYGDTGVAVAGPGAPRVAEFCVAELATRIGQRTEAGAALIGEALELRHRLPRLWARVQTLEVEAWRARRIAQRTILAELPAAGAAFVDRHLAPVAHSAGLPTVDRCLDEAIARYDPDRLAAEAARDPRRFRVSRRQESFDGHLSCEGVLGLDDGLALDEALRAEMTRLRRHGATEADGPLSAAALVGLVCRERQDTLDLGLDTAASSLGGHSTTDTARAPRRSRSERQRASRDPPAPRGRSCSTCTSTSPTPPSPAPGPGSRSGGSRRPARRSPPSRSAPGAAPTPPPTSGSSPSSTSTDQPTSSSTRSPTGCAPRPSRPRSPAPSPGAPAPPAPATSTTSSPTTTDDPGAGGQTSSDNLAPLCRRHHRLKTHAPARHRWAVTTLEPGRWLWRSPTTHDKPGEHYLRDHHGTHPVEPEPPPRE